MENKEYIEDAFPYLYENKKNIIFKRYDNTIKKVIIPNSLRKDELYSLANKYKINRYSDIILYYHNKSLEDNESTIKDIEAGAEIFIFEELTGIDSNYYNEYLKKHNNKKLINIVFDYNGLQKTLRFSLNTTIGEMIKIYLFEMNIPEKYKDNYIFLFNALTLNNDNTLLKNEFHQDNSTVCVTEKKPLNIFENKGKIIKASIIHNKHSILTFEIGTLNQIKDFYSYLKNNLNNYNEIKTIEIEGKDYKNKQNNTFSSVGIRNDFKCNIKYNNDSCCSCIIL